MAICDGARGPSDAARARRLIADDQYAATIARWVGVPETALTTVFPAAPGTAGFLPPAREPESTRSFCSTFLTAEWPSPAVTSTHGGTMADPFVGEIDYFKATLHRVGWAFVDS